jgi:hypothetical protein
VEAVKRLGWTFIIIIGVGMILFSLAGCGSGAYTPPPGVSDSVESFYAETVDGRQIPCVSWRVIHGSGLSCDWSDSVVLGEGLEDEQ